MSTLEKEYRQFREKGGFVDLSGRTHLVFRGADRVRYLNGQLTANIAAAKVPSVVPACITTAKGKLCGDVFVTVTKDDIFVDAERELEDSLSARLEKYIVADDVSIANTSGSVARWHVIGSAVEDVPAEMKAILIAANRFGLPGFDFLQVEGASALQVKAVSEDLLELIRIENGVPRWGFELNENTLPAEAGLDRTHVDFKKGCYIGQEVISRVKSVGHVNRELRGFVADSAIPSGARIFSADAPEKDVGAITSTTFSFALDRPIGLGYLRRGSPQEGLLAANTEAPDEPVKITLHSLPFVS